MNSVAKIEGANTAAMAMTMHILEEAIAIFLFLSVNIDFLDEMFCITRLIFSALCPAYL